MSVSAALDGVYKEAIGLYASSGGEWVDVPLGGGAAPAAGWVRPAEWLPTSVVPGEKKVQALVAVFPGTASNWMVVTDDSTAFTVDWGDGSAPEQFAQGVDASHKYLWDSVSGETAAGYRQALVTITPTSTGALGSLDFVGRSTSDNDAYTSPVLELVLGHAVTALKLYYSTNTWSRAPLLEHISFLTPTTLSATSQFYGCAALQALDGDLTLTGPATSTFQGCGLLREVPDNVTFTGITSMSSMFSRCAMLERLPFFDTSAVTSMSSAFYRCSLLTEIPPYVMSAVTSLSDAFHGCSALRELTLDTGAVTNMQNLVFDCFGLRRLNLSDTSTVTNMGQMLSGCNSLAVIEGVWDLSAISSSSNAPSMGNTVGLRTFAATGMRFSWKIDKTMLDHDSVEAIYTGLPTVTGQTFTVTDCPGARTADKAIATAKGWTVTGP